MKTAMQELIEEIEQSQKRFIDLAKADKKMKKGVDAILTATTLIKMKAKSLLEKEKQQIIEACKHGANFENSPYKNAEDYFEQTFNNENK